MLKKLDLIKSDSLSSLDAVEDLESLEQWRIINLGRSSSLMQVFDQLGQMPKEDRPSVGRRANEVKKALEGAYSDRKLGCHITRTFYCKRTLAPNYTDNA